MDIVTRTLLFLSIVVLSTVLCFPLNVPNTIEPKCYRMDSSFCGNDWNYSTTTPSADHDIVESALNSFQSLIDSGCAAELKKFLCYARYPVCYKNEHKETHDILGRTLEIKPCRADCERVRNKCELLLLAAGAQWPQSLACGQYEDQLCVQVPSEVPTPEDKCENCEVKRKPSAALPEICDKTSDQIAATVRVVTKTVKGDSKRIFYEVQVAEVFRNAKKYSVKSGDTLWLATSSSEDCDCHRIKPKQTYLVSIDVKEYGPHRLYTLDNNAVVMRWKKNEAFSKKLESCTFH